MISSVRCILHRLPHCHEHGARGQTGGAGVELAQVPGVQHAGHHHCDIPRQSCKLQVVQIQLFSSDNSRHCLLSGNIKQHQTNIRPSQSAMSASDISKNEKMTLFKPTMNHDALLVLATSAPCRPT